MKSSFACAPKKVKLSEQNNMEAINFIELFSKNKTTAIIADCWSEGMNIEGCMFILKLNDIKLKNDMNMERTICKIYALLDLDEEEQQEQRKFELSQI